MVSGVKLWTVVGPQFRRKEVGSFALQQLNCVECKILQVHCLLKDKILINDTIVAYNICSDSKISQQYCSLTFTAMLDKNDSHF